MISKVKKQLIINGEIALLFQETVCCIFTRPFYWGRLLDQIVQLGIGSLSITIVIGFVTLLVMTLQFGYGLENLEELFTFLPLLLSLSYVNSLLFLLPY